MTRFFFIISFFIHALLFFKTANCKGQNRTYFDIKEINYKDGLSSYNITKIITDKFGFIWIGTQDGLNRFDGKTFMQFIKNGINNKSISGNLVNAIIEDTLANTIWVSSPYGGIDCIDLINAVNKFSIPGNTILKNANSYIQTIFLSGQLLFIGTTEGLKILDYNKKKLIPLQVVFTESTKINNTSITNIFSFHKNSVSFICQDGNLLTYSKNNAGFTLINNYSFTNLNIIGSKKTWDVFFNSKINQLYLSTDIGLFKISVNFSINQVKLISRKIVNAETFCSYQQDSGFIWYCDAKGLKYYDLNTKTPTIPISDDYSEIRENKVCYAITEDKSKNLWIGYQSGIGFISERMSPFKRFYKSSLSKISLGHTFSLLPINDSIVYSAGTEGVFETNVRTNRMRKVLNSTLVLKLLNVSSNTNIAFSSNNIESLGKDSSSFLKPFRESIKNWYVSNSLQLGKKSFLLSGEMKKGIIKINFESGAFAITDSNVFQRTTNDGVINQLFLDKNNKVVALSENIISVYDTSLNFLSENKITDPKSKKNIEILMDVCRIKDEYCFAAYGYGIVFSDLNFKVLKILNTKNGLSNNGVYRIFNIKDQKLLITTNKGLSILDLSNDTFKNYYEEDGLQSNAFEEGCATEFNGLTYIGGVNGFTIVDPSKLINNPIPPQIFISRIITETSNSKNEITNIGLRELKIENNVLQTNIYFSGLNYSAPTHVTYAYKITELHKDWINLGTVNFITLIGLSPGTYHLQVKAANEDGIWSDPKELVLEFLPKWYQTWWFKLLVFLTTAGIIYAFYRYRIAQIKKQHQIRKNIATDLHDDLGSTLNSVKVFTNLAISGVKQEESLQQIKDNLNEATMGLRDMIWVLDDSLDTVDELITRLKQYATPIAGASNIETIIKADSEVNSRQLTKEEKRNLFLICKEAINNSIKYSEASQIDVSIIASGKKIQITVNDNGKGFNTGEIKKGYGLKNMQYRAGQIKYLVTLTSAPGNGTQIIIQPS